jgi:diphosphomevalonate decarboxylase
MTTAAAQAHPNIAFIKYWGNRDQNFRLPSNGSISMNLDGLFTQTTVQLEQTLKQDVLFLDGSQVEGLAFERVSRFMDIIRESAGSSLYALITSESNFPRGVGIASSASAFAALALAGTKAAGLNLSEVELSRLARRGSGSACRSIPEGFVEWQAGVDDSSSYAYSIASPDHWELADCIAVVSQAHKVTGSTEGHALADTSPLQGARIADADRRLVMCRQAILDRDFATFAEVVESDSNMMHAVMMTSQPRLMYWLPATIAVMHAVIAMRGDGLDACFTIDAGPNVHVLTRGSIVTEVRDKLLSIPGVEKVIVARPGSQAKVIEE